MALVVTEVSAWGELGNAGNCPQEEWELLANEMALSPWGLRAMVSL